MELDAPCFFLWAPATSDFMTCFILHIKIFVISEQGFWICETLLYHNIYCMTVQMNVKLNPRTHVLIPKFDRVYFICFQDKGQEPHRPSLKIVISLPPPHIRNP